jgi:four helix bundle protein
MLNYKTYSFESLAVWQESRTLSRDIYKLTKLYPREEQYGLVSQMRRACISIGSNLAEGTSRISFLDQARFTEISFGSLMELLNQLILSFDLEYIKEETLSHIRVMIDNIGYKMNSLRNSQLVRYGKSRQKK